MKIKSIKEVAPELARCIEVDSPNRLFSVVGEKSNFVSHNSVAQRSIILGTILRSDNWRFLGIDLKKVELSSWRKYSNVVLGVATTLEDALTILRFAQSTMMKRYAEMESLAVNNFLQLPERGQALLVMVDEMGELLSPSGVKALSEFTEVPLPGGNIALLRDLEPGDEILDSNSEVTKIVRKYEPVEQTRFSLRITKDSENLSKELREASENSNSSPSSESFIAGAEHYWVAYFEHPDGRVEGPETVTTEYLYNYKLGQEHKPEVERIKVKFKKLGRVNG